MHASLGALVERHGAALEGRRILLYSYGSGLAGTLFSLYARRVAGPFSLARLAASVRGMVCLHELSDRETDVCTPNAKAFSLAHGRRPQRVSFYLV